jgi:hypothetical protein
MEQYIERLNGLLFEAYGTSEISELPLSTFNDRNKINFSRVRGSVRLMNGKIKTPKETEKYIEKVLQSSLP